VLTKIIVKTDYQNFFISIYRKMCNKASVKVLSLYYENCINPQSYENLIFLFNSKTVGIVWNFCNVQTSSIHIEYVNLNNF